MYNCYILTFFEFDQRPNHINTIFTISRNVSFETKSFIKTTQSSTVLLLFLWSANGILIFKIAVC